MRLRPRILPTLAALVVGVVCFRLGIWQLARYDESAAISETMTTAWSETPLTRVGPGADLAHRRASLEGRWVDTDPAFVTGGLVGGQPGYQLIAIFECDDGTRLLVDRGWVPVSTTPASLAAVHQPGPARITGLLLPISGSTELVPTRTPDGLYRWPLETDLLMGLLPRVLGPPHAAIAAAADPPVGPYLLAVGPAVDEARHRKRGALPVSGYVLPLPKIHHLSYAAQWFGFAGLALLLWLWSSLRREGAAS